MILRIGGRISAALLSIKLVCYGAYAAAPPQFTIDVALPSEAIGLHIPRYPNLMPVPRYPVYYARDLKSNFFFSEGHYWVYTQDTWYTSNWYNGPWEFVPPELVPDSILRVPLLYYRWPPSYFAGWDRQAPPHWGEHWGSDWEERRSGWNHWNRDEVHRRVPPPDYRRRDPFENYSHTEEQQGPRRGNHSFEPRQDRDHDRSDGLHGSAPAAQGPKAGDANLDFAAHAPERQSARAPDVRTGAGFSQPSPNELVPPPSKPATRKAPG